MSIESPSERPDEKATNATPKGGDAQDKKNQSKEKSAPTIPPEKSQNPPSNDSASHAKNKEQKTSEWRKNSIERALFIVECLGILGLGIYCALNYFEWKVFDSERKTMELDERAWISPIMEDNSMRSGSNWIYFIINIKNSGKTPGIITGSWNAYSDDTNNIPKNRQAAPTVPPTYTILAPDVSTHMFTGNLRPKELMDFQKHIPFYIYGSVAYDDMFSNHYYVDFCWTVIGGSVGGAPFHNSFGKIENNQTNN